MVSTPSVALQYDTLVPGYLDFVRQHRGRRTTIQLVLALRRFFRWVSARRKGPQTVGQLTPAVLRDYLGSFGGTPRGTVAVDASALRGWLRYLHVVGAAETDWSAAIVLPRMVSSPPPPPVFDPATVERLLAAVDRSTPLGKRDYAMLLLAARYGLRSKDIRLLRLEAIRWREHRLVLIQTKTQRPLELPLLADVDQALADYLQHGRPATTVREVFVRHQPPIQPFANGNCHWAVMARAARAAHLIVTDRPRGFHRLRHSLATHLLADGVAIHAIAGVLGHQSIETTRRYTRVDLAGLRSVALRESEVCP
jgi:site-specific recombinase XerD